MISYLIETEITSITITIEIFSNKSIYFYVIAKLYDINKCHFIYVYLNICHNKIYFVFEGDGNNFYLSPLKKFDIAYPFFMLKSKTKQT